MLISLPPSRKIGKALHPIHFIMRTNRGQTCNRFGVIAICYMPHVSSRRPRPSQGIDNCPGPACSSGRPLFGSFQSQCLPAKHSLKLYQLPCSLGGVVTSFWVMRQFGLCGLLFAWGTRQQQEGWLDLFVPGFPASALSALYSPGYCISQSDAEWTILGIPEHPFYTRSKDLAMCRNLLMSSLLAFVAHVTNTH